MLITSFVFCIFSSGIVNEKSPPGGQPYFGEIGTLCYLSSILFQYLTNLSHSFNFFSDKIRPIMACGYNIICSLQWYSQVPPVLIILHSDQYAIISVLLLGFICTVLKEPKQAEKKGWYIIQTEKLQRYLLRETENFTAHLEVRNGIPSKIKENNKTVFRGRRQLVKESSQSSSISINESDKI